MYLCYIILHLLNLLQNKLAGCKKLHFVVKTTYVDNNKIYILLNIQILG